MTFYKRLFLGLLTLLLTAWLPGYSQDQTTNKFGKGLTILAVDSSFNLKFSARIQTLYQGELTLENNAYDDGFQIRRARLKFDGFAYHPSFQYKIELAIANSDINSGSIPQSGNISNIILDAYVKWNFVGKWSLWFGQAKLPGNRERVISSQALQFVDRSNVNSRFNLDRDAGLQLHYNSERLNLVWALTMGEGRNIIAGNSGGYDYTFRTEFLPFGQFKSKGDYFSSDLTRESSPKLSIGISYDFNDGATRERGQLGDFLTTQRDLSTVFLDTHFKYKGWSSLIEYANRKAPDGAAIFDASGNVTGAFYTGAGISIQAGYLFPRNVELAGRFTDVRPERETGHERNTQYTLGLSRYFVQHSLKVQTDVTLIQEELRNNALMYRLQLEFAF